MWSRVGEQSVMCCEHSSQFIKGLRTFYWHIANFGKNYSLISHSHKIEMYKHVVYHARLKHRNNVSQTSSTPESTQPSIMLLFNY